PPTPGRSALSLPDALPISVVRQRTGGSNPSPSASRQAGSGASLRPGLTRSGRSAAGACAGTSGRRGATGSSTAYGAPSGGRGSGSPTLGHSAHARSASAVIVSDGFTPRFALTADPSTTCRPGWPWTRWYGSITPVDGEVPIAQPPRMCAVIGT